MVRGIATVLLALLLSSAVEAQAVLPLCEYLDLPAVLEPPEDPYLTLVDPLHRLPEEYEPPDLVPARVAGFDDDRPIREMVVDDLRAMVAAAGGEGLRYELQSAYRSYSYQRRVFDSWVQQLGRERALVTSARPGHSEHQLGTALDLRSAGGPAPWTLDDWAATPEGAWLRDNAWRYGFVMSYPEGREDETCYDYEPWHYRYVGRAAAAAIHRSGETLRSWLWKRSR